MSAPDTAELQGRDDLESAIAEWMRRRDFARTYRRLSRSKPRRGSVHMGCAVAVKPAFAGRRHGW